MIGETEVTQELWYEVMDNNPSHFKDYPPVDGEVQAKRPVESVNWYACIAFCNELTKKVYNGYGSECVYYSDEQFRKVYTITDAERESIPYPDMTKKGFRLPTEAEWEWAALRGRRFRWPGTDNENMVKTIAWYSSNAGSTTHEVKKKQPNGYGLYDMGGNVQEWCWDKYDYNYYPPSGGHDPLGSTFGLYRIYRGGFWYYDAKYSQCAFRGGVRRRPQEKTDSVGLRVVCRR